MYDPFDGLRTFARESATARPDLRDDIRNIVSWAMSEVESFGESPDNEIELAIEDIERLMNGGE